jgi:hypothetical protein
MGITAEPFTSACALPAERSEASQVGAKVGNPVFYFMTAACCL